MRKVLDIFDFDSQLNVFSKTINRRHEQTFIKELEFTDAKKKLSDCFNSYLYYGLHKEKNVWVFREYAPNATSIFLLAESNSWRKDVEYSLKNIGQGNWEIILPKEALTHGELYRLFITWQDGCGDRIPSHVRRTYQDENTKQFSARVWEEKPYDWKNPQPTRVDNPLIYEVHIGMSSELKRVASFNEFRINVLPRIAALGYNVIQIMGVQEHPYYGSFGYQVSNFFAVSSRFGTPEDLKSLIDAAHYYGIAVIMDIVHSHSVMNENEGLSNFAGDLNQYFYPGERGIHKLWNSRCFDYGKNWVLNFLLSNCKFWLDEYRFDGFRFDGVTSMMYWNHGLNQNFDNYSYYYDSNEDEAAITYLSLANKLIHQLNKNAITIAEDMSGMPGLALPFNKGGIGFDFRLSMGTPDYWIKLIEDVKDENWHVGDVFYELTNKREEEHSISYAESHDQAMVGDKTIFFRLTGKNIYDSMGVDSQNINIDRAIALHKMIRLITSSTAGDGYLNFMGNEWGHPEWIDFPREGNNWSYNYARRLWHLVDDRSLRFHFLNNFDRTQIKLISTKGFFKNRPIPIVRDIERQILVFTRGELLFAFNFNFANSEQSYGIEVKAGKYIEVLDTDELKFGGFGRIQKKIVHFTQFENNKNLLRLYLPARSGVVLKFE